MHSMRLGSVSPVRFRRRLIRSFASSITRRRLAIGGRAADAGRGTRAGRRKIVGREAQRKDKAARTSWHSSFDVGGLPIEQRRSCSRPATKKKKKKSRQQQQHTPAADEFCLLPHVVFFGLHFCRTVESIAHGLTPLSWALVNLWCAPTQSMVPLTLYFSQPARIYQAPEEGRITHKSATRCRKARRPSWRVQCTIRYRRFATVFYLSEPLLRVLQRQRHVTSDNSWKSSLTASATVASAAS